MDDDLRKLRVRFQRALLGLLRTDDRSSELLALEEVLRSLGALAESSEAADFWSQCESWVESLRTSRERPKPGYIRFLRIVDQSFKIWLESGNAHFEAKEIPRLRSELIAFVEQPTSGPERPSTDTGEPSGTLAHREREAHSPSFEETAPKEIRSVLSGLAAHPAWEQVEASPLGAIHEAQADAFTQAADPAADVETLPTATPREPKDRVPLSNLLPRLDRVVIQSSRDLAKPAELVLREGGYLDRSLLKALSQPLEQIVRNAIYHGIEVADERIASAKPRVGEIAVTLHRSARSARLEIETDGLAIDFERLQRKGEQMGLLTASSESSHQALLQLLTVAGFSTAHGATQMAGYGIGLDEAGAALEALGGRLEVEEHQGVSLRFVLYLPPGCCGPPELNPV